MTHMVYSDGMAAVSIFIEPYAGNSQHVGLSRHRQRVGLSQEELAHRAEIDRTYVSALERCVYAASIDVLDRLARELGVEAADLLSREPGGD